MKILLLKFRNISTYLTLSKFDTSTEYGREQERYRVIAWSIITNMLSKVLALILMLLTVNLTLPYLGQTRFGVWMTITSLIGALTFLDLGIGNALTNRIANSLAHENKDQAADKITNGLLTLFILSLVLMMLLSIISYFVDWATLMKVADKNIQSEIKTAIVVFVLIFSLNIFSNGVQKVYLGMQRAYKAHLINFFLMVISIVFLIIASQKHYAIPILILVTFGIQSISGFILLVDLASKGYFSSPSLKKVKSESKYLLSTGSLFFILQIGTLACWGGDSLIISSTLGAAYVAILSVTQRMFQVSTVPLSIYNAPLWSAYTDAIARKDYVFVRKTLYSSLILVSIVSSSFALFFGVFGQDIISIWTRNSLIVPQSFIIAFAIWSIVDALANTVANYLNGAGIVRPQVYAVITLVVISIPLKIFVIEHFGLTSMMLSFTLVYIVNYFFWIGFLYRKDITLLLNKR